MELVMSKKIKFKKLTDGDVEYIKAIYYSRVSHEEKMDILSSKFGVKPRTIRAWWVKLDLTEGGRFKKLPAALLRARERELDSDTDILLVTAAQNKTILNSQMLDSMKLYVDFIFEKFGLKAQIVVIPSRYRNPTTPIETEKKKVDMWWDDDVDEYMYYNRLMFGDTMISATSRIRPTASMPLNGYESLAADNNFIIGHPC